MDYDDFSLPTTITLNKVLGDDDETYDTHSLTMGSVTEDTKQRNVNTDSKRMMFFSKRNFSIKSKTANKSSGPTIGNPKGEKKSRNPFRRSAKRGPIPIATIQEDEEKLLPDIDVLAAMEGAEAMDPSRRRSDEPAMEGQGIQRPKNDERLRLTNAEPVKSAVTAIQRRVAFSQYGPFTSARKTLSSILAQFSTKKRHPKSEQDWQAMMEIASLSSNSQMRYVGKRGRRIPGKALKKAVTGRVHEHHIPGKSTLNDTSELVTDSSSHEDRDLPSLRIFNSWELPGLGDETCALREKKTAPVVTPTVSITNTKLSNSAEAVFWTKCAMVAATAVMDLRVGNASHIATVATQTVLSACVNGEEKQVTVEKLRDVASKTSLAIMNVGGSEAVTAASSAAIAILSQESFITPKSKCSEQGMQDHY
uniref:Uncharacterized protein n=1 Tax=Ditylum brightwellii TaxID=49249 RepID=A0A7S1ZGD8_9STRA|mmetsp:Transcript_31316/g.46737  ORF Transcript_31316/g.46737 Transcript_31316/m.46737 type:complete len:421 (+) Transcript_31316:1-1263(+)